MLRGGVREPGSDEQPVAKRQREITPLTSAYVQTQQTSAPLALLAPLPTAAPDTTRLAQTPIFRTCEWRNDLVPVGPAPTRPSTPT